MEILQNVISELNKFKNSFHFSFTHYEAAITNFFTWGYQFNKQNNRVKDKSSDNDWLLTLGS